MLDEASGLETTVVNLLSPLAQMTKIFNCHFLGYLDIVWAQ